METFSFTGNSFSPSYILLRFNLAKDQQSLTSNLTLIA